MSAPIKASTMGHARYAGLDLLTSAVVILDDEGRVAFANAAAETLLDSSLRTMIGQRFASMLSNGSLIDALFEEAGRREYSDKRLDFEIQRPDRAPLQVHGIVTVLHDDPSTP
ncbi:MAG: PAS domain-containing protein, partial [Burkholderiaceae bacterium]